MKYSVKKLVVATNNLVNTASVLLMLLNNKIFNSLQACCLSAQQLKCVQDQIFNSEIAKIQYQSCARPIEKYCVFQRYLGKFSGLISACVGCLQFFFWNLCTYCNALCLIEQTSDKFWLQSWLKIDSTGTFRNYSLFWH